MFRQNFTGEGKNVVGESNTLFFFGCRLVDVAPHYYDLVNFPQCEAKRVLERLYKKREREKEESKSRR